MSTRGSISSDDGAVRKVGYLYKRNITGASTVRRDEICSNISPMQHENEIHVTNLRCLSLPLCENVCVCCVAACVYLYVCVFLCLFWQREIIGFQNWKKCMFILTRTKLLYVTGLK